MATLNVRHGAKVRVFITPSRVKRGGAGVGPVALAIREQLGLRDVWVGLATASGRLANGHKIYLVVTGDGLYKYSTTPNVSRMNITFRVVNRP